MYVLLLNFTIMGDFLNKFLSNVLGFVFGKPAKESLGMLSDGNNYLGNYFKQATGAGLTDAEKEANAFTASREDLAWNRQMEASNTAFQRQVTDMQSAGLNPMLAVSGTGGASVPSAQAQGSVSPSAGDLSAALQFALGMKSQNIQKSLALKDLSIKRDIADAEIANKEADTNLKSQQESESKERERGARIVNDVREATKEDDIEAAKLRNNLSRAQEVFIYKNVDKAVQEIRNLAQEEKTEETKQMLNEAAARLNDMKAYEIAQMLPYAQRLADAETQDKQASACLNFVHAAYQQKLIDDGYVDSIIKSAAADASISLSEAEMRKVDEAVKTGDYSKINPEHVSLVDKISQRAFTAMHRVSTYVLPMGANVSYRASSTSVNK